MNPSLSRARAATPQQAATPLEELSFPPAIAAHLRQLVKRSGNDLATLKLITRAGLEAAKDHLPAVPAVSSSPERDALMKQFRIKVVGRGKIRLELGNTSRIDFLRRVQAATLKLYRRSAVRPEVLKEWAGDSVFTERPAAGGRIGVNGNVAGSIEQTMAEQDAKGLNDVSLCDLAVAHAAYFLVTGRNMFGGNRVRACDGELYFYPCGLDYRDWFEDFRDRSLAASKALPRRKA